MSMAEPAILVNPNTAAMIAMMKNVAAQFNIEPSFPFAHTAILVERKNESIVPGCNTLYWLDIRRVRIDFTLL